VFKLIKTNIADTMIYISDLLWVSLKQAHLN